MQIFNILQDIPFPKKPCSDHLLNILLSFITFDFFFLTYNICDILLS